MEQSEHDANVNFILKPSEIVIPKDNPFANDKLDRKKCAQTLTNLVQNISGPLVMSINGGWGTGKTVFLKMWNQSLQNAGFTTIYFSAWEDDYCNDALIALIGQIWNSLKDSDWKEILKTVRRCVAPVIRGSALNAIRKCSGGLIEITEKQLKSISKKAVDEYLVTGEKLKDLKKQLETLAFKVLEKGKPLVIIIDELDRCRPTFAIELLEKVKHLFNIPGILFILGIDREQLGHSIKCVYGEGMDVAGYLRRFIDMEFILPEVNAEVFCSHLFEQLGHNQYLRKRLQTDDGVIFDRRNFHLIFVKLCACFKLSLRDIEHCSRILVLAYSNTQDNHFIYPPLLSVLVILKVVKSKLYHAYAAGHSKGEEVIEFILAQPRGEDFLKTKEGNLVEAYLFAASPKNWRDNVYSQMRKRFERQELLQHEYLPERLKNMREGDFENLFKSYSSVVSRGEGKITNEMLGYLSEKIELASLMTQYRE
jgi:hypothetical protein